MTTPDKTPASNDHLTIVLDNASLAVRLLGLLGSSTQQWQFFGKVGDEVKFTSATFAAPYSWGGVPIGRTMLPQEDWAPGMTEALADLRQEIMGHGWVEVHRGDQLWESVYEAV